MSETVARPIRKFNPGVFQSDGEVIDQFVVRQHQLDRVLEVMRGNIDSPSCQHVLLIAPRGCGKTMLLARVAAELRADRDLSEHLLPVRSMEENPEIFDMADFWLETLFHLAREVADEDPQLAQELCASHATLTARWRDEAVEESARAVVLSAADRMDKQLVLIVENLQSLVENADKDLGWKLRAVLQSEPQIMLLASSTSRFEGLDDASQPFFEMFRTVELEPLNAGESARLWAAVSGERVSGREIRPLQILTGGSPRLLVIAAGFSRCRSVRKLIEDLVGLIDEHTEYFRSHLEALGKTERRVYIAVIDLWRLARPGEIAARARMDIRTVSTMLGRLVHRGAVLVEVHGNRRLYTATERLYSIYYKLRRESDEAAVVRNLVHFMNVFYGDAEPAGMSSDLIAEASLGVGDSLSAQGDDGRAIEALDDLAGRHIATEEPAIQETVAYALLLRGLKRGERGDVEAEIADCNLVIDRFGALQMARLPALVAVAMEQKGSALAKTGRMEEALHVCEEAEARIESLGVLACSNIGWKCRWVRAIAHLMQGNHPAALATLRSAYAAYPQRMIPATHWILMIAADLAACGAPAQAVVKILEGDKAKSGELAPLVAALRQLAGEDVRASTEVLEVAADVREFIESRRGAIRIPSRHGSSRANAASAEAAPGP